MTKRLLFFTVILTISSLFAQTPPLPLNRNESTNASHELLRQLGAESCTARDRAEEQLRNLGTDIFPILKTYKDSRDPEIQMRVSRLLQGIVPSLRQFLEQKGKCNGFADEGASHWPCVLEVKTFDVATSMFTGTIEWTSLSAQHVIEGKFEADQLVFTETKIIRQGNAILNCVYTLSSKPINADEPDRLAGTWKDPSNGRGGNFVLNLNSTTVAK